VPPLRFLFKETILSSLSLSLSLSLRWKRLGIDGNRFERPVLKRGTRDCDVNRVSISRRRDQRDEGEPRIRDGLFKGYAKAGCLSLS